MDSEKRFWEKVNKTQTCWVWTGSMSKDGYGHFSYNGSPVRSHRFSYELKFGKLNPALHLDHLCRVRHCVNPDHLEAVSLRTNILRGNGLAALNARKTKCIREHEFTEKNTYLYKGKRNCKICLSISNRKRKKYSKNNMGKNIQHYLPTKYKGEKNLVQGRVPADLVSAAKEIMDQKNLSWANVLTACIQQFVDDHKVKQKKAS